MTEIPWYEPLTGEELEGKHVHVIFTHGSMNGCLNAQGAIDYWAKGHSVKSVQILEQSDIGDWFPAVGVESVTLVWDESEWEQIPIDDVSKADAVMANGRFMRGHAAAFDSYFMSDGDIIPFSFVTRAFRHKFERPVKPGYYLANNGGVLQLTDSGEWLYPANDGKWWHFRSIKELTSPEQFMPLTPIHFEMGESDYE